MRRSLTALASIAVFAAAALSGPILVPILFGLLFALVLSPLVRSGSRAGLPAALTAALVLAGIVGAGGTTLSAAAEPVAYWMSRAPQAVEVWRTEVGRVRKYLARNPDQVVELKDVRVREVDKPRFETGPLTARLVAGLKAAAFGLGATLVLTYFMLVGGRAAVMSAVAMLPTQRQRRRAWRWVSELRSDMTRYLTTVSAINLALGVVTAFGLQIAGVRDPWILGGIVAFLNFVPFLGAMFAGVLLGVVGLVSFGPSLPSLLVPAAFLVVHFIESQFVTPAVLGRAVTVNPLFVILAIIVFGGFWGLAGALLAVPILIIAKITFAIVPGWSGWARVLGQRAPRDRLRQKTTGSPHPVSPSSPT